MFRLGIGRGFNVGVSAIISEVLVSKMIGVLRTLKPLLPLSALVLIYNSLIQPHFDYCSVIWDNLAKGLGQKLQRMQNRAARIIPGSDYYTPSSEILRSLNWTNVEDRRGSEICPLLLLAYDIILPVYIYIFTWLCHYTVLKVYYIF
jgi:hypothetical protein